MLTLTFCPYSFRHDEVKNVWVQVLLALSKHLRHRLHSVLQILVFILVNRLNKQTFDHDVSESERMRSMLQD